MSFDTLWTARAKRHLAALPPDVQLRIVRKVVAASADPLRHFARLAGVSAWRLRVGEYRVIADVKLRERRIEVLAGGHRKSVYG
ncbi:MAG TPA: type II toxin-antitoxin system RelE/ParE family toxin [Candidatus Thermoplasmatota archaeon]|nr:type II toxin-antitoxin system RelE/ParE family toxin [Candidatus Thermoplasmatota archaeon]